MPDMTASQSLDHLFQTHHGLIRRQDVLNAGLHPRLLTQFVLEGRAERTGRGVYRLIGTEGFTHEALLEISYQVSKAIVCLLSAMDFHGLSTFVPSSVHLALPRGAHQPKLEATPVTWFAFSKTVYEYGIEEHQVGPGIVRVYSSEKTLADLLRFQKRLGLELFLESLKTHLAGRGRNLKRLLEAARVCGVERSMEHYLKVVLA